MAVNEREPRSDRQSELLYRGKPSYKDVDVPEWKIQGRMQVSPFVAIENWGDNIGQMGVGINMRDLEGNPEKDSARIWHMLSPHDIIGFWRATRIIEELPRIENSTLSHSYEASRRKPHPSDQEKIDGIVQQIGQDTYDRILREPIPEPIVEQILDLAGKDKALGLWAITDEVEAGTLEWRDEFAQIGAKHPDEVKKSKEESDALIARYEDHLKSYAKRKGLPRDCMGMWKVESALVTAIGLGIEEQYGEDVTFGAAVVIGDAYDRQFAEWLFPIGRRSMSKEEYQARFDSETQAKIVETARWLPQEFSTRGGIRHGFKQIPLRTEREYRKLLVKIEQEWPRGKENPTEETPVATG